MSVIQKIKSFFVGHLQSTDVAATLGPNRWPQPSSDKPTTLYANPPGIQPTKPWPRPTLSQLYTLEATKEDYIKVGFERFHAENPEVYKKLVALALSTKANGHKKIGIGLIWERLRWYYTVETTGEKWKLNNNFRAHYARLIMKNEPALADLFRTRELY